MKTNDYDTKIQYLEEKITNLETKANTNINKISPSNTTKKIPNEKK